MKINAEQTLDKLRSMADFISFKFSDEIIRKFLNRSVILLMITALFLPLVVFQPMIKVSAKTSVPTVDSSPTVSAPPLPFNFSAASENGFIPTAVSSTFSSVFSPVADFFSAPEMPLGFSAAHTESPAYSYLASFGDSIASGLALLSSSVSPTVSASNPPSNGVEFDYDGDGKADPAVWHQQSGAWKIKRSSDGVITTTNFGAQAAFVTPGDFDGDSISDLAVFNQGTWAIFRSSTATVSNITLGAAGDRPVSGDFDGDGISDAAVFRPATGEWIVKQSSTGNTTATVWGNSTDVLVPGDFDGDGKTDFAVFRPADQYWYILGSSAGYYNAVWGLGSDLPVPADFDGDGKTDLAVFRPSTGSWYILKSSSSTGENISRAWGNYNDQPVPADYDGDGKADFAVFRPKTGMWHIQKSSDWGYQAHTLGVSTDKLVEAAFLKQNGSVAFDNAFARTRLSPKNATGGTNLYSQNFGWGTGLVGLPGRAGMNAGFGIGYNSLVWIKHTNTMVFDPDYSNVSPGFRMGFPVVEPIYYDGTTDKYTYMMVSPSGARVEFRQTTASNIYETADSSYLQLTAKGATNPNDPAENVTLTVWGTDGTQLKYEFKGGTYNCTQIKDSNGNFITNGYDDYGLLRTVTDTLGRVITVNYDVDNAPINITGQQNAGNGDGAAYTHVYASFEYATIYVNPSFAAGMPVYGPQGLQVKALSKVIYGDGGVNTGETRFEYNNFGQVQIVGNYAVDGHELNRVATNLETPGTGLLDVPRLTQTRSRVENFNVVSGTAQETIVNNSLIPGQPTTDIDGANITASIIQVQMANHPNQSITNAFVGASGWMEGLPIRTDDYTENGNSLKRTSWTKWTQDDPNLSYIQNPRTIATKIGDDVSTKRTEIFYKMQNGNVSDHGLVTEVKLYDGSNNALLKRSTTIYNQSPVYTSLNIIGLPSETNSYGLNQETGAEQHISRATYNYDEGDFSDTDLQQTITPIQHDSANYGASFVVGRGNPTSVTRHDVLNAATIKSELKYNTAGAVVASVTPGTGLTNRTIKIDYTDNFNDGQNRNTYAYPKTITDPAGFGSTVKYRYDTGANVWASSPTPNGAAGGKISTRIYDALGRLERQTVGNGGAIYTRYQYPANGVQSFVYSTVTAGAGEAVSESIFDGAGRVLRSRSELPESIGGWAGTFYKYDVLGRVKSQSVPTEVDAVWEIAGDDASRGWLWTHREYDWKGRIVRKIDTDGDPQAASNASDIIIGYDGCGCAGGQITTVSGEEIVEKDWQGNVTANLGRRTQKIYADVLGRSFKTEVLNWDATVYSSSVTTYNGRDQAISLTNTQAATAAEPAVSQISTMSYDGFGRMKTRKLPQQDAATAYNHNADDSISTMTDARGAMTNYLYDIRGLVTNVNYTAPDDANNPGNPDPTVPVPAPVSFEYDAPGNRKKMTDGLGTVDYLYNDLSQMTSENRQFTDAMANAPTGGFKLTYTYTLSGQLKSIKDPYNDRINYTHDKTGRLTAVTGTSFGGVTNYASSPHYRAWGGLQSLSYGNATTMTIGFNERLQADTFRLTNASQQTIMDKSYEYYADGKLRKLDDKMLYNTYQATNHDIFDRLITYDHVGRPKTGKSSAEARGGTVAPEYMEKQLPYRQSYQFNAFGNLTQITKMHWGSTEYGGSGFDRSYTYQNNVIVNDGWEHDADGRTTKSWDEGGATVLRYDAAGRLSKADTEGDNDLIHRYDGNGADVKRTSELFVGGSNGGSGGWSGADTYLIRSSVLGGRTVTEADATGRKKRTYVVAAGAILAWQEQSFYNNAEHESVKFKYTDASGMSERTAGADGLIHNYGGSEDSSVERDPLGGSVGMHTPYIYLNPNPGEPDIAPPLTSTWNSFPGQVGQQSNAVIDGVQVPLWFGLAALADGSAEIDFANTDRWALINAGIFAVWRSDSGRDAPDLPDTPDDPDGVMTINTQGDGGAWEYHFTNISWKPGDSRGGLPPIPHPGREYLPIPENEKCESYLAQLLTGTSDATFSDVTDGAPIDTLTGMNEDPNISISLGMRMQTHNHGYNPLSDPARNTPIFAPAGGILLGGLRYTSKANGNQSYVTVFYPILGRQKNVVLQFFHVENFTGGITQNDGRILLGAMGENGIWSGYPNGQRGYHYHINAWLWWGGFDRRGNPRGANNSTLLPPEHRRNWANTFKLSKLCPFGKL